MNRKRIFGIVIFIALGFFMFTFANPNEKIEEENKKTNIEDKKNNTSEEENIEQTNDDDNATQDNIVLPIQNNALTYVPTLQNVINDSQNIDNEQKEDNNQNIDNDNQNNGEINDEKKSDSLKDYISAAKVELEEYALAKKFNSTNEQKAEQILSRAFTVIENANDKDEIDEAVNNTKKQLDALKNKEILDNYKDLQKQNLKNYADLKDFDLKYIEEMNNILNRANNAIDDAKTNLMVDSIITLANKELDELKDKEILNNYKNAAILEIENHIDDLDKYRDKQQEEISEIISSSIENINNATSNEEIDGIKDNAINDLNDIKTSDELYLEETRLVTFIDKDKKEIKKERVYIGSSAYDIAPNIADYSKNGVTYTFNEWSQNLENIEEDITVSPVYKITKVVARIFELKENVDRPMNGQGLSSDKYRFVRNINLDSKNSEVISAINNNKRIVFTNECSSYLENSNELDNEMDDNFRYYEYYVIKYELDGFHIDRELVVNITELNNYRKNAINEIENYVNSDDYRLTEQTTLNKIVEKTTTDINDSTSKTTIDSLVQDAKKDIDSLKTNFEYLTEARNSAIKEIVDYIESKNITIDSYKIDAKSILNKYSNLINSDDNEENFNNYVTSAKGEIDSLIIKMNKFYTASVINPSGDWNYKYLLISEIAEDVKIKKVTFIYDKNKKEVVYNTGNMTTTTMINRRLQDSKQVEIEYIKAGGRYVDLYNVIRKNHFYYNTIEGLELVTINKK